MTTSFLDDYLKRKKSEALEAPTEAPAEALDKNSIDYYLNLVRDRPPAEEQFAINEALEVMKPYKLPQMVTAETDYQPTTEPLYDVQKAFAAGVDPKYLTQLFGEDILKPPEIPPEGQKFIFEGTEYTRKRDNTIWVDTTRIGQINPETELFEPRPRLTREQARENSNIAKNQIAQDIISKYPQVKPDKWGHPIWTRADMGEDWYKEWRQLEKQSHEEYTGELAYEEQYAVAESIAGKSMTFLAEVSDKIFTEAGALITTPFRYKGQPIGEYLSIYPGCKGYEIYEEWKGGPEEPYLPLPFPTPLGRQKEEGIQWSRIGMGDIAELIPLIFIPWTRVMQSAAKLPAMTPGQMLTLKTGISFAQGQALLRNNAMKQLWSDSTKALLSKPKPATKTARNLLALRQVKAMRADFINALPDAEQLLGRQVRSIEEKVLGRPVRFNDIKLLVNDANMTRGKIMDILDGFQALSMGEVAHWGHIRGRFIFQYTKDWIIKPNKHIQPKIKGAQYHVIQVLENPSLVKLSPQGRHFINAMRQSLDDITMIFERLGIKIEQVELGGAGQPEVYIPRWSIEKAGIILDRPSGFLRGVGSLSKRHRAFLLAIEAQGQLSIKHVEHPLKILDLQWRAAKRRVSTRMGNDVLRPLEKWTITEARQSKSLVDTLERLIRGRSVTEAQFKAIEKRFPMLGAQIRLAISTNDKNLLERLLIEAKGIYAERSAIYVEAFAIRESAARELLQARRTVRFIKGTINGLNYTEAIGYDLAKALDTGLSKGQRDLLTRVQQSLIAKRAPARAALKKQLAEAESILVQAERAAAKTGARAKDMLAKAAQEFGEARIPLAGFEHRVFKNITIVGKNGLPEVVTGEKVIELIKKKMGDEVNWVLRLTYNVASTMRLMKASLDFSPISIQLAPYFIRHPKAWGESWKGVAGYINPHYVSGWMRRPENFRAGLEFAHYSGMIGEAEFTEAAGLLSRGLGKIPKAGKYLSMFSELTFGRGNQVFSGTRTMGVINVWKAMQPWAAKSGHLSDLALFLNRSSGFFSFRGIGMNAQMSAFLSSFVFFAPRFTVANTVLISDIFRGGVRARFAIEHLGSMIVGTMLLYIAACEASGQEPHLDPRPKSAGGDGASFGSFLIGDTKISPLAGVWSMMRAMIAIGSDTADMIVTGKFDPERLIRPFRARTSMLTSYFWDMITGRDYIGEATREDIATWGKFTGEQLVPIWIEGVMQAAADGEKPGVLAVIAAMEFAGGRTYPELIWDKVRNLERQYINEMPIEWLTAWQRTQAEKGVVVDWSFLKSWQRNEILAAHPDLKELRDNAIAEGLYKYGDTDVQAITHLMEERLTDRNLELQALAEGFRAGEISIKEYISGRDYKKAWSDYYRELGWDYFEYKDNGFREVVEDQEKKIDPADQAIVEYWRALDTDNPENRNERGIIDWDKRGERREGYLNSLTPEIREYVLAHQNDWIIKLPPEVRQIEELILDCETILDAYYAVKEGKPRLEYRSDNPDVDARLIILRGYKPRNFDAIRVASELLEKYGLPPTVIGKVFEQWYPGVEEITPPGGITPPGEITPEIQVYLDMIRGR